MTVPKQVSYRRNAARLISLLMQGRYSLTELAEKTPMHYERARTFILDLKAEGVVHISAWRRDSRGRASVAIYTLGLGVDAKKPKPMTAAQRTLKYKHRKEEAAPLPQAQRPRDRAPRVSSVFDLASLGA